MYRSISADGTSIVAGYVKETGDQTILDEHVPYDNEEGSATPLYEHLERSLRYTLDRLGPHGLPLIGRADWNDCLNLNCFSEVPGESFQTAANRYGGAAESVFIGGLFVLAARELAEIANLRELVEDATAYQVEAEKTAGSVVEHGWDGAWFRRAYDYFGNVVGSPKACASIPCCPLPGRASLPRAASARPPTRSPFGSRSA